MTHHLEQTPTPPMSSERFAALCEAWGGQLEAWPVAEQASAQAFAEQAPHLAQPLLAQARELDELLQLADAEPFREGVAQMSVARALRSFDQFRAQPAQPVPTASHSAVPFSRRWQALAACALLGIGLAFGYAGAGLVGLDAPAETDTFEQASTDTDSGLIELEGEDA